MSKKVAIIGAGPSGLVTAKTLLHNFPPGSFSPIIFDSQNKVGGLWSNHPSPNRVNGPPVTLDPRMRTNLSRFTVAFSDLAWESVIPDSDIPVFPRATQVGEYLACYAERYVPTHVLRLGCKVIRIIRKVEGGDVKWNVQWVQKSAEKTHPEELLDDGVSSEDFDLIVIASGYFAQQYIPNIPGLDQFQGQIIHSSSLHHEREQLLFNNKDANGRVVVIGGSMSGVEAASAVALHQSSSALSTNGIPHTQERKVHHVHSRPFWTLPTYLPHESPDGSPSFLPLDLAMYDLGRRPPGPIEYTLGPIPEERAVKMSSYFHSLLGSDYEKYAHMHIPLDPEQSRPQPPWVAIGNDYAEFVRCGAIQTSMGRVTSIHSDPDTKQASVQYEGPDGATKTIENVAAIIMATGFTPYKSLSLLPDEVLATLEYSKTDPFSPLILDKGGTVRSEIPDVGFVGFYRGPYWGVMEMQARFLGKLWSGENNSAICETDDQKQSLRSLRLAHPDLARGQFPMADYVGLMESFAMDLDISRSGLQTGDNRSGPAVPARYLYGDIPTDTEVERTLSALRDALVPNHEVAQKAAALAIFRALHGTWKFSKQTAGGTRRETSGTLAFYPRYPTSPVYDREYVFVETYVDSTGREQPIQDNTRFMRLAEAGFDIATSRIEIWSSGLTDKLSADQLTQVWELTPLRGEEIDGETIPGEYVISAKGIDLGSGVEYLYTFHFKGVSILSWECVEDDLDDNIGVRSKGNSYYYVRD